MIGRSHPCEYLKEKSFGEKSSLQGLSVRTNLEHLRNERVSHTVVQPTPVFLPGESHGQRSLVGYSPWGRKELDMTEWLSTQRENFIFIHHLRMWPHFIGSLLMWLVKLKWSHTGLGWALHHDWYPCKRPDTEIQGRNPCGDRSRDWSDATVIQGAPRIFSNSRSWKEAGTILLQRPHKEPTRLTPWFRMSDLQNSEKINFCCFKPPKLWSFVTAALENKCMSEKMNSTTW